MYLKYLLFAFTCIAHCQSNKQSVLLSTVDDFRLQFLQLEEKLWDFVSDSTNGSTSKEKPEIKLLKQFRQFGDLLQKHFPHDLSYALGTMENVHIWAQVCKELRGIYNRYERFRKFQILEPNPSKQIWLDFTNKLLQTTGWSVMEAQNLITDLIVNKRLYEGANKEMQAEKCSNDQSPQQLLYNLYNNIELTELKGYMMIQFSYMLNKLYDKGDYVKEAQQTRKLYEKRLWISVKAMTIEMNKSSRQLWKCDPLIHTAGMTYIEITQLLQGYIQNEVDLNPKGSCLSECKNYGYTKSHSCYQNLYCNQQRRCNGKVIQCQFIASNMLVCPSNNRTDRRYEYIEYENGRIMGRKQTCEKGTIQVESWWRWLVLHCSYCFCLCDEQGVYSDRYINMRSVIADVMNNRVVTGLRFAKKNRIIHIQIQEGKLLPRGAIDENTVRWVPVENYKITDRNIYNKQDYHTLSYEQRIIGLDDLESNQTYLVTGVRFMMIGDHLTFQIHVTEFNFETGKLIEPEHTSVWESNNDVSNKTEIILQNPDVPTCLPTKSKLNTTNKQYVKFTNTDIDRDAAQTTVPFFDAQPVTSTLPVPLAGAGIYHKGGKNSGGFIGLKIFTYDFSKHLHAAFPRR